MGSRNGTSGGTDVKNQIFNQSAEAVDDIRSQFGALCWRMEGGELQVLLITSRDSGRWIIPKGWPMAGKSPDEAAAIEAWEEAGVKGMVSSTAIGLYSYAKGLGSVEKPAGSVSCVVAVYPLQVTGLVDDFPEVEERRRKWFSPKKAAARVEEPELRALVKEAGVLLRTAGLIDNGDASSGKA